MGTSPVFALCPHIAAYVQQNTSRWPFSVPGTAVRLTQEFLRETYELHHTVLPHFTGEESEALEGFVAAVVVCLLAKEPGFESH